MMVWFYEKFDWNTKDKENMKHKESFLF